MTDVLYVDYRCYTKPLTEKLRQEGISVHNYGSNLDNPKVREYVLQDKFVNGYIFNNFFEYVLKKDVPN